MARNYYTTPSDVVRRFDLSRDASQLESDLGAGLLMTLIVQAEQELEEKARKFRLTETQRSAKVTVSLSFSHNDSKTAAKVIEFPNADVVPPEDSNKFELKYRVGNSGKWIDITNDEGSRWVPISWGSGEIEIYFRQSDRIPRRGLRVRRPSERRYIRANYEYGARGGERHHAGESTLGEALSSGQTGTVSVADANFMSPGENLINGEEFVHVSNIDRNANEITIDQRGIAGTDDVSHDNGDTIRHVPESVRNALAGKVAHELYRLDKFEDVLASTSGDIQPPSQLDLLMDEWDEMVSEQSDGGMPVR